MDAAAKYDATAEALVEKIDDGKKFGKVCDNVREKIDKKKKNNKKKFRKEKKPKVLKAAFGFVCLYYGSFNCSTYNFLVT